MKFCVFVGQGFDNCSVGGRRFRLDLDLVVGECFGFIVARCDLLQPLQQGGHGDDIRADAGRGLGGLFRAGLVWTVCFVRFFQRRIAVGCGGGWRVKPVKPPLACLYSRSTSSGDERPRLWETWVQVVWRGDWSIVEDWTGGRPGG
jgi:hypothetical protein